MEVKVTEQDGAKIVSISGKLDTGTVSSAQETIEPLLVKDVRLVLEMKECTYVSSAGLRLLLMIAKTTAREGGRVVGLSISDEIKEVMEMTGFGSIFPNHSTLEDALAAVK